MRKAERINDINDALSARLDRLESRQAKTDGIVAAHDRVEVRVRHLEVKDAGHAATVATIVDGLGRLERRPVYGGGPVPPYVECHKCAPKAGAYLLCPACLASRTRADRAGCTCHVITSRACPVHPWIKPKAAWARAGTIEWAAGEAGGEVLVRRKAWPKGRAWDGDVTSLDAEDVLAEDWEIA